MHYGDEPVLHDLRRLWHWAVILNRPERPRSDFGADIASAPTELESHGQMTLAHPDFIERLNPALR